MLRISVAGLALGIAAIAAPPTPSVTFNKDVLPILQNQCQNCHRPGEVAPMSFLSYKETRPWASAIKSAVLTNKMPPWFADPAVGHFSNERRLTASERATLVAWVESGAPEGDDKDRPAPVEFADGWSIGKPDIVVEMPNDIPIPATGIVNINSVYVKVNFPHDMWVQAAEIRPGNRQVVHHMKAWVQYPESPDHAAKTQSGRPSGSDTAMADGGRSRDMLCKYNPGLDGQNFTVGDAAKFIPAGSDIVFETHYTSNGKATTDRSKVGIVLAKASPKQRFFTTGALTNHKFTIPAGDPNYELKTEIVISQPVQLTWLQPHMHMRGKDFLVRAVYPTGESEVLLKVPHFEYNWQVGYEFAKPVPLPKGTRLESIAHFDNSVNNPSNPDPTRDVPYGAQTWDEMSVAFFSVVVDVNTNPLLLFRDRNGRVALTEKVE
jgi:hypothetical protein